MLFDRVKSKLKGFFKSTANFAVKPVTASMNRIFDMNAERMGILIIPIWLIGVPIVAIGSSLVAAVSTIPLAILAALPVALVSPALLGGAKALDRCFPERFKDKPLAQFHYGFPPGHSNRNTYKPVPVTTYNKTSQAGCSESYDAKPARGYGTRG